MDLWSAIEGCVCHCGGCVGRYSTGKPHGTEVQGRKKEDPALMLATYLHMQQPVEPRAGPAIKSTISHGVILCWNIKIQSTLTPYCIPGIQQSQNDNYVRIQLGVAEISINTPKVQNRYFVLYLADVRP